MIARGFSLVIAWLLRGISYRSCLARHQSDANTGRFQRNKENDCG